MMKFMQNVICCTLLIVCAFALIEARPGQSTSAIDNNQDVDNLTPDVEDERSGYYDLPAQAIYPSIPMDRLQMMIAQYRPNAYLRSPSWNSVNELYRMPESKRQVRYRQCYFNPISCFKK